MSTFIPTLADLQRDLGGIPLERILMQPLPGMATEEDLQEAEDRNGRMHELIDGILVEKAMGYYESVLAIEIAFHIRLFLQSNNLGRLLGADGFVRVQHDQIRAADVAFVSWKRLPDRKFPRTKLLEIVPELVIEILSQGNTEAEMTRKRWEYFQAGVQLVWIIDPEEQTARIYTEPEECTEIDREGGLNGGSVLPGFELNLGDLFDQAGERAEE